MNEKILIITDAASDVSPESIAGKPVKIVAAYTHVDDRTFRDFYDIRPPEYWEILKTCKNYPTTSMAAPLDYLEAYREAYEQGYTHIICTQVTSTASGTITSATMGKELLEAAGITDMTIEVVDTLTYSVAYGHNVVLAADKVMQGAAFAQVLDWLRTICPISEVLFGVYTLKYLRRSGRVGGVAAFAGEALGLRPIMLASRGACDPVERVRGDKNVIPAMIACMVKRLKKDIQQEICIIHSDIPEEDIELLSNMILEAVPSLQRVPRYQLGSTITTNTGPHTIAVTYYADN